MGGGRGEEGEGRVRRKKGRGVSRREKGKEKRRWKRGEVKMWHDYISCSETMDSKLSRTEQRCTYDAGDICLLNLRQSFRF